MNRSRFVGAIKPKFKVGDTLALNAEGRAFNSQNNKHNGRLIHLLPRARIYNRSRGRIEQYDHGFGEGYWTTVSITDSHTYLRDDIKYMHVPEPVIEKYYDHE